MTGPDGARRTRRELLRMLGSLGAAAFVAGCGGDAVTQAVRRARSASTTTSTTAGSSSTSSTAAGTLAGCSRIPEETAGPYPGDGSNGPNVLAKSGAVRSDIRSSIGSSAGAPGVPLTLDLTVVNASGCSVRAGAAVYVWHCDAGGNYSMYSAGATGEDYLRGVQGTGASGRVVFASTFPGCYSGRWPHIHFEVFPTLAAATSAAGRIATSQLALPGDACEAVYATSGYSRSATNLSQISLARDNVFSDGVTLQMASMTGTAGSGYTAKLVIAV